MVMARDATSKYFEKKIEKKRFEHCRSGRARCLAREARDHKREEPNLHLDIYQRDVTDDAVTLGTSCVKEPSRDGQSCADNRERSAACFLAEFPLFCMETVDHDALWRVSLNEVQRRGALWLND